MAQGQRPQRSEADADAGGLAIVTTGLVALSLLMRLGDARADGCTHEWPSLMYSRERRTDDRN